MILKIKWWEWKTLEKKIIRRCRPTNIKTKNPGFHLKMQLNPAGLSLGKHRSSAIAQSQKHKWDSDDEFNHSSIFIIVHSFADDQGYIFGEKCLHEIYLLQHFSIIDSPCFFQISSFILFSIPCKAKNMCHVQGTICREVLVGKAESFNFFCFLFTVACPRWFTCGFYSRSCREPTN